MKQIKSWYVVHIMESARQVRVLGDLTQDTKRILELEGKYTIQLRGYDGYTDSPETIKYVTQMLESQGKSHKQIEQVLQEVEQIPN